MTDQFTATVPEPLTTSERKTFLAQAQETASQAFNTTVDAVREHPVTAAAAVAGAAAAVAGAAYGASKLKANDSAPKTKAKPKK
ncbi:hypothetical protein [Sphingomonas sp.]|uniref:hypothetical protein n=1 Tax=Sphingomonas sp. TaxID=28214 RepID=UPI002CAF7585|nr:hypothetical protein [Sphingomonas sp.]HWK34660.1 hypothetical protein [Sphingomonas sp.]